MRKLATAVIIVLVCIDARTILAAQKCSAATEAAAARASFVFNDWQGLFQSYNRFGSCDTGGDYSEGYSETVVRLLADHWSSLPELQSLSAKHPRFGRFVLSHIDATVEDDDLGKILRLSTGACPAGAAALCKQLASAAREAIDDQKR